MVLNLLPFKRHKDAGLEKRFGYLRFIHHGLSLTLVLGLWFGLGYRSDTRGQTELI